MNGAGDQNLARFREKKKAIYKGGNIEGQGVTSMNTRKEAGGDLKRSYNLC